MDNTKLKSGIYSIKNSIDNKEYIGLSINLKKRKSIHFSRLRKNIHPNKHLQFAWNKYGEINFTFIVIEYVPIEELESKEIFWIRTKMSNIHGYNIHSGGKSCMFVSEETRKKLSRPNFFKGKKGKDHPNSKVIYQYNLDGVFLKKWYGTNEIKRELKIDICRVLAGDNKSAGGFMWSRTYALKIPPHTCAKRIPKTKPVNMLSKNGDLLKTFISHREASDFLKVSAKCFSAAIKRIESGTQTFYHNYKWISANVITKNINS